jgi:hypothetical protein
MTVSSFLSYSKVEDVYGEIEPLTGFHRSMLEAGIRRVESLIAKKFSRHIRFLQLICRSAMNNHGKTAHTILLESFGQPLFAIQNMSYTLQSYQDRTVYVVRLEEAFAQWKLKSNDRSWTAWVVGGLCICGIGLLAAHVDSAISSQAFLHFYQT